MSGGNWVTQNKVRPGAYINFTPSERAGMRIGERGVATLPMELEWGDENKLINVYSSEMVNGRSLSKVGFTALNEDSLLLDLMLSNCREALVYRLNTGGEKATLTLGNLFIEARCTGELGNKIQVAIVAITGTEIYEVKTFVNKTLVDIQRVINIKDLNDNGYVKFAPVNEEEEEKEEEEVRGYKLAEFAGESLTGGTNGKVAPDVWNSYFKVLSTARWQVMAVPTNDILIQRNVEGFINSQRDDYGRYVKAVLCNFPNPNNIGIINSISGGTYLGRSITPEEFTAWVAGASAGATITESLTGKIVNGFTELDTVMDNEDIINALREGKFLLSLNQDGQIAVEQDINSFIATSPNLEGFSQNRTIRTLDEIGTTIKSTWERTYMGKIDNNENGRNVFRGDIITYMTDLENIGAIQNFEAGDVVVSQGESLTSVLATIHVQPVGSMEKLYLNVSVTT